MEQSDVIILGGGLVGLSLGIALQRNGISTTVIEAAEPKSLLVAGFDGRASAVASGPWKMLQAIGVGDRLEGRGCPIESISVQDGLEGGMLRFDPDADDGALGFMFENRVLRNALYETALETPGLNLIAPAHAVDVERDQDGVIVRLNDGREIAAGLLVAAEGRQSPTRDAAGISMARWQYDHVAMIASLSHSRPHGNTAYEIFYSAGPFALLPLNDLEDGTHRSAMVWTVPSDKAPAMIGLPDRAFLAEAQKRMGGLLGEISLLSPRSSYPLSFQHAAQMTDTRLALVGDAAHGIHPIAGQGVNLGYRDVAALVEVLVEGARLGLDPGDAQLLARYQRWRSFDTLKVAASTDSLVWLFGLPGRAPRALRRFGLAAVQKLPPLKRRFMAEARGETGALPRLLQGLPV